jgi:hypothetical protein
MKNRYLKFVDFFFSSLNRQHLETVRVRGERAAAEEPRAAPATSKDGSAGVGQEAAGGGPVDGETAAAGAGAGHYSGWVDKGSLLANCLCRSG